MKKIFFITLILGIVLVGCSRNSTELTDQYVLEEKVDVVPSKSSESTLIYPVVKDLIDKDVEKKINDSINGRIEGFKSGLEEFNANPDMEDQVIDVKYDVGYKTKEMLSIKFDVVVSMGSFGIEDHVIMSKNFDLKTGEFFKLKDILKGDYKKELDSKLKPMFSEVEGLTQEFQGVTEDTGFYIKDDNLVVFFDSLDYGVTIPLEFKIPFSEISDILKKPLALGRETSPDLDNYNTKIDDKTKPFEALFFIRENISNVSLKDATTMFLSFEEIQEKYIGKYEEVLIENEIQEKLLEVFGNEFDENKIDKIGETDLEALLREIINGGYMIINLEGLFTIIQDYRILEEHVEYLPDDIKDYILLKADGIRDLETLKIGENLSWKQIKDRIIKCENYIEAYPESIKEYIISKEHMEFLHSYFFGFDGMPSFDYSTNKINEQLLQSYKEFININGKSETAKIVEGYLEVLESNEYLLCEEIEEYRRIFSSINEEYF